MIADKDETGRAHARVVATALRAVVKGVKLIELPDVNGKPVKDSFDFFAAGGTGRGIASHCRSCAGVCARVRAAVSNTGQRRERLSRQR